MLGVKVATEDAEKVKKKLLRLGIFDKTKKVKREQGFVIFPVAGNIKDSEFKIIDAEFETEKIKKFRDYLAEFLSQEEIQSVHRSFDLIGDIAIIEISEEMQKHEKKIAEALIKAHKGIKTVFKKSSEVKGEQRVRELCFLAGENKTETLYKEHGCRFKLDVSKVYFSPRLSYERQRILEQTEEGEVVVDMFAGIGPFSILLAKHREVKVYAIDVNPVAVGYLKENLKLNKIENKVIPLLGDCREVAPRGVATRVIMNLPKSAHEFLDLAFEVIKKGVIHFYSISPENDLYFEFIKKIAKEKGRKIKILNKRIVRPYAPRRYHVAIDIFVFPRY